VIYPLYQLFFAVTVATLCLALLCAALHWLEPADLLLRVAMAIFALGIFVGLAGAAAQ